MKEVDILIIKFQLFFKIKVFDLKYSSQEVIRVEITLNLHFPDQYALTKAMKTKINVIRNIALIKEIYKSIQKRLNS